MLDTVLHRGKGIGEICKNPNAVPTAKPIRYRVRTGSAYLNLFLFVTVILNLFRAIEGITVWSFLQGF